MLTARPPGPRTATRIVVDSQASLPMDSHLVRTADEVPVLLAVGPHADHDRCDTLRQANVEVLTLPEPEPQARLLGLLQELGRRQMSNVLVEGGSQLLGALRDLGQVDEVHAFVCPKIIGGGNAATPMAGEGVSRIGDAWCLDPVRVERVGADVYIHGHIRQAPAQSSAV